MYVKLASRSKPHRSEKDGTGFLLSPGQLVQKSFMLYSKKFKAGTHLKEFYVYDLYADSVELGKAAL